MRQIPFVVLVLLVLSGSLILPSVHAQVTASDITGGSSYIAIGNSGVIYAFPILISVASLVWAISVNWAGTGFGNVHVALYSNNYTALPNKPSALLTDSGDIIVSSSVGWQDIPVALKSVPYGNYWVAIEISQIETVFAITSPRAYYYRGFGPFNSTWPDSNYTIDSGDQWNMRIVTYPPTFIIQPFDQQYQTHSFSPFQRPDPKVE